MRARRCATLIVATLVLAGCGGGPKAPPPGMDRFNAALCAPLVAEDTHLPLDPNLEGIKADIALASRTVASADKLQLSLTFRNTGLHGTSLALPQRAFSLAGFDLVDHACSPVSVAASETSKALAYRNSGPMPLNAGESATVDMALSDRAPGLALPPGIYAVRLALRVDAPSTVVRGTTLRSSWALFAVTGGK
jgi:hypothetical protein